MALYICNTCNQHIVQPSICPHCTKPNTMTKGAVLGIPMAIMLGLGCSKKETTPTPEVMALYGGPPIEVEEVELQTETENNESADNSAGENSEATDTNTEQSGSSTGDDTEKQTENEAGEAEIKPDPVEEMVKPLYGVDITPIAPVEREE